MSAPARFLSIAAWAGLAVVGVAQQAAAPARPPAVNPHEAVPLWTGGAPGSEGKTAAEVISAPNADGERTVASVNNPSIAPYVVRGARTPTAAVIVMPGGGHYMLSIDHEGYAVAQYLSGHGVAAFVLKYRLAREKGSTYTVEGNELDDVQRAIRMVRANAAKWNVDPERVGVMGFSAGGELAALAATRFHPTGETVTNGVPGSGVRDDIDKQSDKPAFEALMYPGGLGEATAAVAGGAAGAAGPGRGAGAGASAAVPPLRADIASRLSKDTPPAFMLCGADDQAAIGQVLPELFLAFKKAGVSAELHEYAGVGHGFGLRVSQHGAVQDWPAVFVEWMDTKGFLRAK